MIYFDIKTKCTGSNLLLKINIYIQILILTKYGQSIEFQFNIFLFTLRKELGIFTGNGNSYSL